MKKIMVKKLNLFFASKPAGDPEGTSEIKDVVKNVVSIIAEFKKAKADDNKIKGLEWVVIGKAGALPLIQKNVKNGREPLFESSTIRLYNRRRFRNGWLVSNARYYWR